MSLNKESSPTPNFKALQGLMVLLLVTQMVPNKQVSADIKTSPNRSQRATYPSEEIDMKNITVETNTTILPFEQITPVLQGYDVHGCTRYSPDLSSCEGNSESINKIKNMNGVPIPIAVKLASRQTKDGFENFVYDSWVKAKEGECIVSDVSVKETWPDTNIIVVDEQGIVICHANGQWYLREFRIK